MIKKEIDKFLKCDLHLHSSSDYSRKYSRVDFIEKIRKADLDVISTIKQYQQVGASAMLLDAWHPELKGGTGHSFDWSQFPQLDIPLILAGGLKPENIENAIKTTKAYAVDVSGGVESAKGIKDQQLIEQFMQGVHRGSAK